MNKLLNKIENKMGFHNATYLKLTIACLILTLIICALLLLGVFDMITSFYPCMIFNGILTVLAAFFYIMYRKNPQM